MTFISAIVAQEGLVLAADSKELFTGGHLLWEDFANILETKGSHEDDPTFCISPEELKEKFRINGQLTLGRIKSTNGAKKLFQIGTHSALLIAGLARLNDQEFSSIIDEIKGEIEQKSDYSFKNIKDTTFAKLKRLSELETAEDKNSSEFLFAGYDEVNSAFKVEKFLYIDQFQPDGQGGWVTDTNGQKVKTYRFASAAGNPLINTSGWTNYIGELGTLNYSGLQISLPDAFSLSKSIMDLVVTIERISNTITGIGGKIYYATITQNGFQWVESESDVLNVLR